MLAVEDRLRHTGRRPSTMDGISKRLLRAEILQLVARIESDGVTNDTLQEVGRLLRGLEERRIPGLSVFPQLYVMSVWEREWIYKGTLDPYLEAELLGPSVGDAAFYAMRLVLEECYGLSVSVPEQEKYKCKWNILRGDAKVGNLTYDRQEGHRVPRLRATLARRTIAFCYRPVGLVVETRIHFNPRARRQRIRSEVLSALRRKEDEFMCMLEARPSDFLGRVQTSPVSNGVQRDPQAE